MKTPKEFVDEYKGRAIDYDGSHGVQCVDLFKIFCAWTKQVPVYATPNGWADGYWYSRNQLGYYNYFDYITDYKTFQDGDWVMWARGSQSHPSSHIAMYYQGLEFGMNQSSSREATLKGTNFSDALGALRWKGFNAMKQLQYGYSVHEWNGIKVNVLRSRASDGFTLHMISADGDRALKNIMEFDSDALAINGCVNANYFEMSNGTHLGCEGDSLVNGYSQFPKADGVLSYYIKKDGSIGAHDEKDFWLGLDDIQMVCSPYAVRIHEGKLTYLRSTAFGDKDDTKNTQTIAFKLEGDWCLAIFDKCCPRDTVSFAQQFGNVEELIVMDSGGSTQMFECFTTGKRKAVRDTGRKIPNVLVLAKPNVIIPPTQDDTVPTQPSEPSEPSQPVEPEPQEPIEIPSDPLDNVPIDKINWKQKLSSRKFWALLAGLIIAICHLFGVFPNEANVNDVLLAIGICVAYIFGESWVDVSRDK